MNIDEAIAQTEGENSGIVDIPAGVVAAAFLIQTWADSNGLKYWSIGGVCDRRFEFDRLSEPLK